MALIEFKNFSFTYINSEGTEFKSKSLSNIDLEIDSGDFVLICGPSGCGKTTLLTNLKKELMPNGLKSGEVKYDGVAISKLDDLTSACEIGYLFQNPDSQIVTDTVIQEIAFPLENIGLPTEEIRNRISEIVAFFGINDILHKNVNELSGGQKQLVNLCSLLVLRPKVLLLDEPMSQLDPIASYEFLSIIRRLNEEFSITVLMSGHRVDSIFPLVDKVVFVKDGKIKFNNNSSDICNDVIGDVIFDNYVPIVTKIYNSLLNKYPNLDSFSHSSSKSKVPLSIRDGRRLLNKISVDLIKISKCGYNHNNSDSINIYLAKENQQFVKNVSGRNSEDNKFIKKYSSKGNTNLKERIFSNNKNILLKANGLYFAYDKQLILKNVDFILNKGEFISLIGGNGVGKSTFLQILVGILKPIKGKVKYKKGINLAYVHQNPIIHFSKDTVKEELLDSITYSNEGSILTKEVINNILKLDSNDFVDYLTLNNQKFKNVNYNFRELINLFGVKDLLDNHPYDCSGGEQQKLAIIKALIQNSDVLILDEPTKGLDPISSKNLAGILNNLVDGGLTILMTSHDLDFIANNCKRCLMLFDKDIQIDDNPKIIFAENNFYTTFVNRMVKDYIPEAVTFDDVKLRWDLD